MKLKRLLEKFNYTCFYCHRKINETEATRDHYEPDWRGAAYKRRGGGNRTRGGEKSFVLSCRFCNLQKGHLPPNEFIRKINNKEIFILR